MKRSHNLFPICILVWTLLFAGCGKPNQSGSIKIGIIVPLTGSQAAFGEALKNGYRIAADEVNSQGGVLGKKMELDFYDDRSVPDQAVQGVAKLADQDEVPLIAGAYSSENTKAIIPAVIQRQIPLIVPTATADNVMDSHSPWVVRICATASDYARTTVAFLKSSGAPKSMAIVYENTNYGQSSMKAMMDVANEAGINLVAVEPYKATSADYKSMLQRVKQANPDVIYFVSYFLDASTLMRQAREVDLNPRYYTSAGGGFIFPDFPTDKGAGKSAEYTFSLVEWLPNAPWPGAREFDAEYVKRYGSHPDPRAIQAYAALKVAARAISDAKSLDRARIRDSLRDINLPGTPYGPIRFDANGQNPHPVLVTQILGGQYHVVFPADSANTKPVIPTPRWSER